MPAVAGAWSVSITFWLLLIVGRLSSGAISSVLRVETSVRWVSSVQSGSGRVDHPVSSKVTEPPRGTIWICGGWAVTSLHESSGANGLHGGSPLAAAWLEYTRGTMKRSCSSSGTGASPSHKSATSPATRVHGSVSGGSA